ncbi:MAG: two pore domain potassium channel family protein [Deltaproteobacteria bacterium]|nr:two pore domain potassium channel family protein [Deltaproteobacteria bacterium]
MIQLLSIRFKFRTLLILLFTLAITDPILKEFGVYGLMLLDIIFTVALLTALYSVSSNKSLLITGIILVVPIFILGLSSYAKTNFHLTLLVYTLAITFFVLVGISILIHIMAEERVTVDLIYGSACVYLIIGFAWAIAYGFIEMLLPGSFQIAGKVMGHPDLLGQYSFLNENLVYYSFVTLTTLGYGDITPLTGPAKTASALEAIVGQLYIALLVARLVGLQISQSMEAKREKGKTEEICNQLLKKKRTKQKRPE